MRLLHLPCFAAQYHRLMAEDPPEHPARLVEHGSAP